MNQKMQKITLKGGVTLERINGVSFVGISIHAVEPL